MKAYKLSNELKKYPETIFNLYDENGNIYLNGGQISAYLWENYQERYILHPLDECWTVFTIMFWQNYLQQIIAQNTEYDPTKTYNYTETKLHIKSDGEQTKTHTPDSTHNSIETTSTFNNSRTITAGSGANMPRSDNYSIAYDTDPKHTGYTTTSGQTTETNTTNGTGDKVKTIHDLKYTDTTAHTAITKTIGDKTYSGDRIEEEENKKEGYQNANIAENLQAKIDLFSNNIAIEFIQHFIDKYTFYAGGDEIVIEFV